MGLRFFGRYHAHKPVFRATAPSDELNTVLFHSTYRIEGTARKNLDQAYFATAFFMRVPKRESDSRGFAILLTAAHVLENIIGDYASLLLRRSGANGYIAYRHEIRIRKNGEPLYAKHSEADVAALRVNVPSDLPITPPPIDFLATDEKLESILMRPGDEVFCLGFPLGAAPGGFPLLRSGYIASYPIVPMRAVKQIEVDMPLMYGNSGSPVYYCYRDRRWSISRGRSRGLLGIVCRGDHHLTSEFEDEELGFGIVAPAPFLQETIAMLPA